MSRVCKFRVIGRLDKGSPQEGTVSIDRAAGLVSVRPLRRRREYTLSLSRIADFVCTTVIRAELAEKRAAKGRKRHITRRRP